MADENKQIDENELVSWAEQKLGDIKPYTNYILLGLLLFVGAFGAILLYIEAAKTRDANQFRELNIARLESFTNQSSGRLLEVADTYAGKTGGNWALMLAGMYDLRTGMNSLPTNRAAGLKLIGKAEENLEKLVNSSGNKSTDLQRRSVYSLAYAKETLGKFDEAKGLYEQVLTAAPDSALASFCERGVKRCENQVMKDAYAQFKDWKDMSQEEAPGPNVEQRPDISSPDIGDLDLGGSADETKADETKADETKADETKADETKADETKADETKADETKADETKPTNPRAMNPRAMNPRAMNPSPSKRFSSVFLIRFPEFAVLCLFRRSECPNRVGLGFKPSPDSAFIR